MNLPRQIGPFELLETLGAGGMGEVFRARDTRLNRFVAIKFLPAAASATARERFQREALAIAALNHPNICTLFEAGEHAGQPYLVMELLEGETLYSRLRRGAIPMPQLAEWGAEMADALEAAHAKGILHRDLKPGNIFVTSRGAVKVLDFGLAQFALATAADAEAPTITSPAHGPLTTPGTALGTFAYMSPEQARGGALDARSDLFSLGVVLYEMAGGRAPFRGRTSADLMAAILKDAPPPPSSLQPGIPARLDDIIAQCLEKDPNLRFQTAADLRASLRRLLAPSSSAGSAAAAEISEPRRRWLWPLVAAAVIAAGAAAWWKLRTPAPAPAPPISFRQLTFSGQVASAAISPDGRFVAYTDLTAAGASLHLLSTVNGSDTQIMPPGPNCCSSPSFSPDSGSIYFLQSGALRAIPVLGGSVRTIANDACSGAGFSPHGSRIAYLTRLRFGGSALTVARADGSRPRLLSNQAPARYLSPLCTILSNNPDAPAWSPDGRHIAVERESQRTGVRVIRTVLVDAASGNVSALGPPISSSGISGLAWLPDGSGLLETFSLPASAPPQLWELTVPGGVRRLLTHDLQGYSHVSVSSRSPATVLLLHSNASSSVWAQQRPGGGFEPLPGGGASNDGARGLTWTPQGRIVSVRAPGGQSQLWLEGGASPPTQLTLSGSHPDASDPMAAANGQIIFQSKDERGKFSFWRSNADGSQAVDLTANLDAIRGVLAQQGTVLVFINSTFSRGGILHTLWEMPVAGGTARQVLPQPAVIAFPLPGGQRILVVIGPVPLHWETVGLDGSRPQAVSLKLAGHPPAALTPDGRALAAVRTNGGVDNIWAAPLDGGPPYPITRFTDLRIASFAFAPDGRLAVSRGSIGNDVVLVTGLAGQSR